MKPKMAADGCGGKEQVMDTENSPRRRCAITAAASVG
jgi:hypothetical protein